MDDVWAAMHHLGAKLPIGKRGGFRPEASKGGNLIMAKSKHLLILANSIKHWPGVCIAGREINSTGRQYAIGAWVRPVSAKGEGELSPSEAKLVNGKQPVVMDFVEVQFLHANNDRLQPENWLIDQASVGDPSMHPHQKPGLELLMRSPRVSGCSLAKHRPCLFGLP